MRIISGQFKGRRFFPPNGLPTRPTTDIAKEGLFNILNNRIDFETASLLDLFAGTGSISYEFASRGCQRIMCVDKFPGCIKFIRKMAVELGIESILQIHQADVFSVIANERDSFSVIFAGPPYPLTRIPELPDLALNSGLLMAGGLFILEHDPSHTFTEHPHFSFVRNYGQTHFAFFQKEEDSQA